jgi:hypothetical protein
LGILTNWLSAFKLTGAEKDEDFPEISGFNLKKIPAKNCISCVQRDKDGHKTFQCAIMTAPRPTYSAPNLTVLRTMQYLISTANYYAHGLYDLGYGESSEVSLNFLDSYTFIVESAVGNVLTVKSDDLFSGQIWGVRRANWGVPGFSFLPRYGQLIQPGDVAHFGGGSFLDDGSEARVVRVTVDKINKRATVILNRDVSGALEDVRQDQTSDFTPSVTFSRNAADPERWTPIVDPSEMKCFPRLVTIKAEDIPDSGIVELLRQNGTSGRCADPVTDPDKRKTFQVWRKVINEEITEENPEPYKWEDITAECLGRLKRYSTGAGADGRGAYKSVLCLRVKNWDNSDAFSDDIITDDVESIRVFYYPEVADGYNGIAHSVPCGRRCAHSIRDHSGSFYAMEDGEVHLSNGEEWFCRMRVTQEDYEITTGANYGRWGVRFHRPARTDLYTADCSLYGVCPMYQNIKDANIGDRPFTLDGGDGAVILREMLYGMDVQRRQFMRGYAFFGIKRVGRPSINFLTNSIPAENTDDGDGSITFPRAHSGAFVGDFNVETDSEIGEYLNPIFGGVWDGRVHFRELEFPDSPPDGFFSANIPGYQTKKDPYGADYNGTTDPTKSVRNYDDDFAIRTGRGDGAPLGGRGFGSTARAISADESFVFDGLDISEDAEDVEQERIFGTFKIFKTIQTDIGSGFPYRATITFKNLSPKNVSPAGSIVSGKIKTISVSGGIATIEVENKPQTYKRVVILGVGDVITETFSFFAGGGFVRPSDPYIIRSGSSVARNSHGNVTDLAAIGDGVKINYSPSGAPDFQNQIFPIMEAVAFGGSAEANFGGVSVDRFYNVIGGYYQVPKSHLEVAGVPGRPVALEIKTLGSHTSSDTDISVADVPAFASGQVIQCVETEEYLRVNYSDNLNNVINVTRGISSYKPATAIPDGSTFKLIEVYNETQEMAFEDSGGDSKPAEIESGKYWKDTEKNRYFISPLQHSDEITFSYYISDGIDLTVLDRSFVAMNQTPFNYYDPVEYDYHTFPSINTQLTNAEFNGTATSPGIYINGTSATTITTGIPNNSQVLKEISAGGYVVLTVSRDNAGAELRINTPQETGSFDLDIADVPEYATGAGWGKRRDKIKIKDDDGLLAAAGSSLIGRDIEVVRQEMIFSPDSEISSIRFTAQGTDEYEEIPSGNYKFRRGIGIIYLNDAAITLMRETENFKQCIEVK